MNTILAIETILVLIILVLLGLLQKAESRRRWEMRVQQRSAEPPADWTIGTAQMG